MTRDQIHGTYLALAAFLWWGLVPIYFDAVGAASPTEVLAHRIVWSVALLAGVLSLRGKWPQVFETLRNRRNMGWLMLSTLLVSINWLIFIWSISADRLLEASLGYYINPLVNVLLGVIFLGERLKRLQGVAVFLAVVAVLYLTWRGGVFPWVSLTLAFSFGFYGLVRKRLTVGAIDGLFIETMLIMPLAVGYLAWLVVNGEMVFAAQSRALDGLLLLAGVVTAVPLICFAAAARRLNYSTVGMLQYIAPTTQFLVAVLLFGEVFTEAHAVSFTLIWLAVTLFSLQSYLTLRRARKQQALL